MEYKKQTLSELSVFNGTDNPQLQISVCGRIYDLESNRAMYEVGTGQNIFTGKDATYSLAMMQLQPEAMNTFEFELDNEHTGILQDWVERFKKQSIIGYLDLQEINHNKEYQNAQSDPFENIKDDQMMRKYLSKDHIDQIIESGYRKDIIDQLDLDKNQFQGSFCSFSDKQFSEFSNVVAKQGIKVGVIGLNSISECEQLTKLQDGIDIEILDIGIQQITGQNFHSNQAIVKIDLLDSKSIESFENKYDVIFATESMYLFRKKDVYQDSLLKIMKTGGVQFEASSILLDFPKINFNHPQFFNLLCSKKMLDIQFNPHQIKGKCIEEYSLTQEPQNAKIISMNVKDDQLKQILGTAIVQFKKSLDYN